MAIFSHRGSFDKLESFLARMQRQDISPVLHAYAQQGVTALSTNTPMDSGRAASSWWYEIEQTGTTIRIFWTNDNIENGFAVAVMIQYGYGTGTGGYVQGRDYINPAMRPIFDRIAEELWKVVRDS